MENCETLNGRIKDVLMFYNTICTMAQLALGTSK